MMEHFRDKMPDNKIYQAVDSQSAMVIDIVTGKPERFGPYNNSVDTVEEAIEYIKLHFKDGWSTRFIIVKMESISVCKIA